MVAPRTKLNRKAHDVFARNILSSLILFGVGVLWNYLLSQGQGGNIERFISMIVVTALAVGGGVSVGELVWRSRHHRKNQK